MRLENSVEDVFDSVVAASGHQSSPRQPPEVQSYTGEYLHAHDYRGPEPFTGRRVLVIGAGNSGVDIAAEHAWAAEQFPDSPRYAPARFYAGHA